MLAAAADGYDVLIAVHIDALDSHRHSQDIGFKGQLEIVLDHGAPAASLL
ncbi:MAG: hypothetical protein HY922_04955 [Elusimicrobia bacterium]|nr:hypothetical protein [Elusimicrobiota bacterium]